MRKEVLNYGRKKDKKTNSQTGNTRPFGRRQEERCLDVYKRQDLGFAKERN